MTNPAATRAAAPVAKLAELDNFGRADEAVAAAAALGVLLLALWCPVARSMGLPLWARPWRRALRLVKYRAEPKLVRRAEGRVPRHRERMGFEDERMAFMVGRRAMGWWDCWTRVLRRSAGWRRMAEVRPEQRPAAKWKVDFDAVLAWVSF